MFKSEECYEKGICPSFELSKRCVRASKDFIKNFEQINSFDVIVRLKSKTNGIEVHEFKVDFSNLQYLTRDLAKIEPYNMPLIIFNFDQQGIGGSSYVNAADKKGMYFTT